MKTKEEAIEDLTTVLPYLRNAMTLARKDGEPQLGILSVNSSGGGRVVVQFRADEFVSDLCVALGLPVENTPEEESEAAAERLVQMVHRAGGKIRSEPLTSQPGGTGT